MIYFEISCKLVPFFGGIFGCNRLNLNQCPNKKRSNKYRLGEQVGKLFALIILGLFGHQENQIKDQ